MEQHTENSQNKEISGYTPTTKELLFEEVGRLHYLVIKNKEAQYEAAQRDDNSHRWIGISNITLTVIVGASIFVELTAEFGLTIKLIQGTLGILAATLGFVQSFLGYSSSSNLHKSVASKYSNLEREIRLIRANPRWTERQLEIKIDKINSEISRISEDAPLLRGSDPALVLWRTR